MKTIWKLVLDPMAPATVTTVPKGAEVLAVHEQDDEMVCLWMLVDVADSARLAVAERREFIVVGTGHVLPEGNTKYLGTAFLHSTRLVLHVFEVLP